VPNGTHSLSSLHAHHNAAGAVSDEPNVELPAPLS